MNELVKSTIAVTLTAFLGGCWRSPSQVPVAGTHSTLAPQNRVPQEPFAKANGEMPNSTGLNVSEEEMDSFGFGVARASKKKDLEGFLAAFDLSGLAERIHMKSETGQPKDHANKTHEHLPTATRKAMESEVRRIIENFAQQTFRANSFLPFFSEERGGITFLRFRAIKQGGSPEYYKAELKRVGTEVKLVDLYFYLHNEWWSNIIRFEAVRGEPALMANGAIAGELDSDAGLREMFAACMRNDHAQALELYRTLPRDDRERRLFLFPLIRLTSELSNELFQPTVDEVNRLCPDDVQINVSLIAAFQKQRRWDEALRALNRAEVGVGGDPYLGAWGAQILLDAGKPERAKAVVARILEHAPYDWTTDCWILRNCLARRDFAQAVEVLKAIEREFDDGTADQMKFEEFPEFLESPEYAAWRKRLPAKE